MGKVAKVFAPKPPAPPPTPAPLPVKDTSTEVATKSKSTRQAAMNRRGLAMTRMTPGTGVGNLDDSQQRRSTLGGA